AGRHCRAAWRRIRISAARSALGCAAGGMQHVDTLMRDYSGGVPGASVLVVRDGHVVLRKSYGMANLEEQIAATPGTNYRLASVTKQFTAAAILLWKNSNKLSLGDHITKYLDVPEQGITI